MREMLSQVNEWLRFAETKNGVLVATSGVAVWGSLRLAILQEFSSYLQIYFFFAAFFFALGFVASLISFLPVLSYRWIIPNAPKITQGANLLYFGHLATYSKNQLVASCIKATGGDESDITELDDMYSEQIIMNSRIALAKFAVFERSVTFVLCGVLTPIFAAPLLYFSAKSRKQTDGFG